MPKKKKDFFLTGLTLIELIITTTIFVLIVGILYSVFILNQHTYSEAEKMDEITQNGKIILERITRELRQTNEIVTPLPDTKDNPEFPPPEEILFRDGHVISIVESGYVQGGTENSVILDEESSEENDYYKDLFVKIISGPGNGEVKKILKYDGVTKTATIKGQWSEIPDQNSTYKIDSSYYYIRYFKEESGEEYFIKRQIIVYYLSGDPNTYFPFHTTPPEDQRLESQIFEDEIVGEYVKDLSFFGGPFVNIFLNLENRDFDINFQTGVFARNL